MSRTSKITALYERLSRDSLPQLDIEAEIFRKLNSYDI